MILASVIQAICLLIIALPQKAPHKITAAKLDCPVDMAQDQVCVFTDDTSIIAINPTTEPVKVVVQIQRIENVELVYRYPFVEELPPSSSRLLIKYKIKSPHLPFALDYDWGWKSI